MHVEKWKTKKYNIVGRILRSDIKIVERVKTDTLKHDNVK
jgi:hypothetical protein